MSRAAPDSSDQAVDELLEWVTRSWDPQLTLRAWWERLADAGWAFPTWPPGLGGRGLSRGAARAVGTALAGAAVIGPPRGVGQALGGPTLLAHGTEEQQAELVPALARGSEAWCQLFSEPGAGSDLASLQTSAVRDGDAFVVNGQKVWSSGAHIADRGLLLARTDRSVAQREGITYFVIDMDQPGVEVRPLVQMNGAAEFCEVFLTDAVVSVDRAVGEPGGGWRVAQTTLAVERAGLSTSTSRGALTVEPGRRAGMLDRTVGDLVEAGRRVAHEPISGFMLTNRAVGELARQHARQQDPVVRQQLARYWSLTEVNKLNNRRAASAAARGERPGAESSVGKLAVSGIAKASRELSFEVMGAHGMLDGDDAPRGGSVHRVALASFGASIGGGTDEIQRNVIGERVLGLPREPEGDRDLPFEQLPVGTQDPPTGGETGA